MKLNKVLTAFALATAISFAGTAWAETLTVGSVSAAPGDTGVSVPITIDIPENTAGASFTITYDSVLTLTDITSTFFDTFANQSENLPEDVTVRNPPPDNDNFTTYDQPLIYSSGTASTMVAAARISVGATETTMFTLKFSVAAGAAAQGYAIDIEASVLNNKAAGYDPDDSIPDDIPMLIGYIQGGTPEYPVITPTIVAGVFTVTNDITDTDGDGIDDGWENTQFGDLLTATENSDFDKDGYSDLEEYKNGTDPNTQNPPGNSGYNIFTDKQATLSGDFDGNNSLDLLLRDQVSGQISILFAENTTPTYFLTEPNMDWVIMATGDYNGDGKSDILWHNTSTGQVYIYLVDGTTKLSGSGSPGTVDVNYLVQTSGDFDGDGNSDILWRHKVSGIMYIWYMDGTTASTSYFMTQSDTDWVIKCTGDFNGDGYSDLLWRNSSSGQVYIYLLNGSEILPESGSPGTVGDLNYSIKTTGDYDGNGQDDIVWRHQPSGILNMWFMNAATISSTAYVATQQDRAQFIIGSMDTNSNSKSDIFWLDSSKGEIYFWKMNGHLIMPTETSSEDDFNGDGTPDILWQNQNNGNIYMWFMNGAVATSKPYFMTQSLDWLVKGTNDFDSDGNGDILWYNSSTGQVYIYMMDGTNVIAGSGSPGIVGDTDYSIQATGDFNGDGSPDILWQNQVTGKLYMWFMNGAVATSKPYFMTQSLIWNVVDTADFNGDGNDDILWHNSSTGQVYIYMMDGTSVIMGSGSPGIVGDTDYTIDGTGDFDGDGTPDILWKNQTTGKMYVWFMNSAVITGMPYFMTQSDLNWVVKNIADYNSDGNDDILWHNSSTGQVYIYMMSGVNVIAGSGSPGIVGDTNYLIQ